MPRDEKLKKKYKIGRNQKCPCGSGIKFKKCHLGKTKEETFLGFVNNSVYKEPRLPRLNIYSRNEYPVLTRLIEDNFMKMYQRGKLILPNLQIFNNESIGVFSDYSGEGAGLYNVYSFLVCGLNLREIFHVQMSEIRKKHKLFEKEIAYKDFGMGQIKRAIPDYLSTLDRDLSGLLLTVAVEKSVLSLFGPQSTKTKKKLSELLKEADFGDRKPEVTEKLLRITHIAAFLIGLLARNGQKIFWMTDNDAIAPNKKLHRLTLKLLTNVIPMYSDDAASFPPIGGALPFAEKGVEFMDLLSATDITAGAFEAYLSERDKVGDENVCVKEGADKVLEWLGHNGVGLKKMCIVIRKQDDESLISHTIEITPRKTGGREGKPGAEWN